MTRLLPLLLLVCTLNAGAQIIPAERTVTWQGNVGIPGGIPTGWPVVTNMTGLDTNGVTDVTAAIQNAINTYSGTTNGIVILLPPGTLNIAGNLTLYGDMILRAASPTNTTCVLGGQLQTSVGTYTFPRVVVNWTNGFAKGTTNIMLDDVSGIYSNQVLAIDELNNTNFVNPGGSEGLYTGSGRTGNNPFTGSTRCYPQLVKVTAISGNQVTIDPPLYLDHDAARSPQAFYWGDTTVPLYANYIGIEGIKFDASSSGASWPINFEFANYCWVKDCEIFKPGRACILFEWCYRYEVCDTFCRDSRSIGSNAYGVETLDSSAGLIWNNRFSAEVSPVVLGAASTGNVIAYNFVTNSPAGFKFGDWFTHAVHCAMNLFEGNLGGDVYHDCIHGSGSHNTTFRSYLPGFVTGSTSDMRPYAAESLNQSNNVVGNVMGTAAIQTFYEFSPSVGNDWSIFYLGFPTVNGTFTNNTGNVPVDPLTVSTILRCANWTTISNAVDNACSGSISNSYFLAAQPSWWTNWGATPWPPIGSDLTPRVSKLPAQLRYEAGAPPAPTNTLVVTSTNPGSGVSITVAPADNLGNSNGVTPFTRYYNTGTSVTLATPPAAAGNGFSKWQTNGVDASTSTIVIFALNANTTASAIYTNTPAPPTGRTIAIISGGAAIIGGSIIP